MAATEKQIDQMGADLARLERLLEREQAAAQKLKEATEKRVAAAEALYAQRQNMIEKWEKTRAPRGSGDWGKHLARGTRIVAGNWRYMVGRRYVSDRLIWHIRDDPEQWEEHCMNTRIALSRLQDQTRQASQE